MPLIKHFLRVMFYYKVNFIFTIGVPIATIVFNMHDQILRHPGGESALSAILYWTGYMIVLYALMNSGPALVLLREDQFLKMFFFIANGSRRIIAAKFFSQLIVLFMSVFILDAFCAFLFSLSFVTLCGLTFAMVFICELPVYLLFLIFASFRIRQETVLPIINILIFIFLFLSLNDSSYGPAVGWVMTMVNPMAYTSEVGLMLLSGTDSLETTMLIMSTLIYSTVGFFALKHLKILPVFRN